MLSVVALAACGAPGADRASAPASPGALELGAAMPGPGPRDRNDDAADENARCEGCHVEIALEWRSSLHAAATTDPDYQAAFDIEPLPFCRACHTPEADPGDAPPPALAALGVGCVTCHLLDGGDVLASPWSSTTPRPAPHAPHGIRRTAAFASDDACRGCHEFLFPQPGPKEWMQSTASEHMASPFAATSCAGCHMPHVADAPTGHRSHVFAASRDVASLRGALSVRAERYQDGRITLHLEPRGVGHAYPTGDLFRRLLVRVEAVGPDENTVHSEVHLLTRRFAEEADARGARKRILVDDSRLFGPRTLDLHLNADGRRWPVRYEVVYERVAHPGGVTQGDAEVAGSVVLASGVLAALP
jgi:hypothetical protein